ncbi:MAG: hypothetical protein AAF578_10350 [Pseudomonadota bacterium]
MNGILISAQAYYCGIPELDLTEEYAASAAIVVAVVESCEGEPNIYGGTGCLLVQNENLLCTDESSPFRAIVDSNPCQMTLIPDHEYLLFIDKAKQIRHALPLERNGEIDREAAMSLAVLRDVRDGALEAVGQPWSFHQDQLGTCILKQRIERHTLVFGQRPRSAGELKDLDLSGLTARGQPHFSQEAIVALKAEWARPEVRRNQFRPWIHVRLDEPGFVERKVTLRVGDLVTTAFHGGAEMIPEVGGFQRGEFPATYSFDRESVETVLAELEPGVQVSLNADLIQQSKLTDEVSGASEDLKRRVGEAPNTIAVEYDAKAIKRPLAEYLACTADE